MPASVFLHIGRSKTGSTTIQSLATDHREFMEQAGFRCPLTLNGKSNHGPLADALRDSSRASATLEKFVSDLSVAPSRKVFLSAETLCEIPEDGVRRLKNLIADHEVLLLLYIRDYPSWVTSRYAQAVRFATRADDFDTYFKALRKRVSIVPALRRWATAFGANALHVRTLDPVSLNGGTLISDVLHAFGVESAPPDVPPLALAPHWIMLELQRALASATARTSTGEVDRRSGRIMRQLLEESVRDIEPARVQYLTRSQWHDLAELYRADMKVIEELTGMSFPVSLQEPGERPFLPAFRAAPRAVKAAMLSKIEGRSLEGVKPAIRGLVEQILKDQ
ncbi:hypothetical protein BH10PSE6_BH10PSE6_26190 [soil metagenome]